MKIQTIPYHHPLFPDLLKEIGNDCPSQIYLSGNTELLTRKKRLPLSVRENQINKATKWPTSWGSIMRKRDMW